MPANLIKLVSVDGLSKVYPLRDASLPDSIGSNYVVPLRATALREDEIPASLPIHTRRYRFYGREFNRQYGVFVNEYREVL